MHLKWKVRLGREHCQEAVLTIPGFGVCGLRFRVEFQVWVGIPRQQASESQATGATLEIVTGSKGGCRGDR